jgi:hypothetical protein
LDEALQGIRTLGVLARDPNDRRVFDRHPDDEFRDELKSIRKNKQVDVDVIGLSLKQFCFDYLDQLAGRGNVNVRLLIQHPFETTFQLVCHQEGREEKMMLEEVLFVTEKVLSLEGGSVAAVDVNSYVMAQNNNPTKVEIKWFPLAPSITFSRLNQVMFVRARYLGEASHPPMFFERYYQEEGRCFDSYLVYFNNAWEDGIDPTMEMCRRLRAKIEGHDVTGAS